MYALNGLNPSQGKETDGFGVGELVHKLVLVH